MRLDMLSFCASLTTVFKKGGVRVSSCFRFSVVSKGRMLDPREKLYLSSSLSYHMLIALKSFMLSPALGWMFCMVAATTVFKFSRDMIGLKNEDNSAASIRWDGQF